MKTNKLLGLCMLLLLSMVSVNALDINVSETQYALTNEVDYFTETSQYSVNNLVNAFDGSTATYADIATTNTGEIVYIGHTFDETLLDSIYFKSSWDATGYSTIIELYDGSTWTEFSDLGVLLSHDDTINIGEVCQGWRVKYTVNTDSTRTLNMYEYTSTSSTDVVYVEDNDFNNSYHNTENVSVTVTTDFNSNTSYDMGFYLTKLLGESSSIVNGITLVSDKITLSNTFDDGMVAYYPLTTDSLDYSGNGNDGTEYGGVVASGTSYEFDGVDDDIRIDKSGINIQDKVTISFWIKPNQLNKEESPMGFSTDGFYSYLRKTNTNALRFKMENTTFSDKELSMTDVFTSTDWVYFTLIADTSTNYIGTYKNGVLFSEDSIGFTGNLEFANLGNFYIGQGPYPNFNGSITDVRIYNRSLSTTEIENLYNESRKRLGLVLDLPLRDTEEDYSPADNTITLYDDTYIDEDGAHFDGVDDYINTDFVLPDDSSGTFSVWAKSNYFQNWGGRLINKPYGSTSGCRSGSIQTANSNNYYFCMVAEDGSSGSITGTTGSYVAGKWQHIVGTYDSLTGDVKLYVDSVLDGSNNIPSKNLKTGSSGMQIGTETATGTLVYWNGSIKDVKVYNRALSQSEISDLYNSYNFKETSSTYTTLFNLSDYTNRSYCQVDGTTLDWGTTSDYSLYVDGTSRTLGQWFEYGGDTEINLTFVLTDTNEYEKSFEINSVSVYCGVSPTYTMEYVLWNDTTSGTLNLFNLTEGSHELNLYLQSDTDDLNYSYNFITDYTSPTLTQLKSYQEGYKFYFYDVFDIDELYIDTCYYQTNGVNKSCSSTQYYTTNGNYTINVSLTDLAGNSFSGTSYPLQVNASYSFVEINSYTLNLTDFCYNTSTCTLLDNSTNHTTGSLLFTTVGEKYWHRQYLNDTESENVTLWVNPYIYTYFYDESRLYNVENFTFGDYDSQDDYVKFKFYDLGLGSQSLDFVKPGYALNTFTFVLASTSQNFTFNVTPASLYITLYDMNTKTHLDNWSVAILQNDIEVYNGTEYDLFLYWNESISDYLEIQINKSGYNDLSFFVDLGQYSSISQQLYLLLSNSTFLMPMTVMNVQQTKNIANVSISLYIVENFNDYLLTQQYTDTNGKAYFWLSEDYLYKAVLSKDGYIQNEYYVSPYDTSYTFLLAQESSLSLFNFGGFNYKWLDSVDNNTLTLGAKYFDQGSSLSSVLFSVVSSSYSGSNLSTNPTDGTLTLNMPYNTTDVVFNVTLRAIVNGETKYFTYQYVYDENVYNVEDDIENQTEDFSVVTAMFVTLGVLLIAFIFGAFVGGPIGSLLFGTLALVVLWYFSVISSVVFVPVLLLLLLGIGLSLGGGY